MLYHAVPLDLWLAHPDDPYSAATLRTDGTMHCSVSEEALLAAMTRFPRKVEGPLLALVIDEEKLDAPVTFEAPADGLSSQVPTVRIRGPVNRGAVVAVMEIERDGEGRARRLVSPPPQAKSPRSEETP
jgi:uncharacterized protein (DUF952 family)